MIKIDQLNKNYNDQMVVVDASTQFHLGEVTAIIGPNGAGKSTLLSMASRLTNSDSGEVIIADKHLSDWTTKDLAKRLSVLRQSNQVNMRFTVRDLVAFGRFPHSQGRLTEVDNLKIDAALDRLSIQSIANRFIDELSGGQRQMAFIAMVVAQDTDYIFLDEPLNNLDIKHSVEIMSSIRRLAKEDNRAVIIVIHDINFASCYSDNIVAMKRGEVIKQGKVSEVVTEPVLSDIYEIPFNIEEIDGQRICMHYHHL